MAHDAVHPGSNVIIVDDLLATGAYLSAMLSIPWNGFICAYLRASVYVRVCL